MPELPRYNFPVGGAPLMSTYDEFASAAPTSSGAASAQFSSAMREQMAAFYHQQMAELHNQLSQIADDQAAVNNAILAELQAARTGSVSLSARLEAAATHRSSTTAELHNQLSRQ